MPKISNANGPTNEADKSWPGSNSEQSEEKQQNSEANTSELDELLAPTMENPLEKDQTDNSSAFLTDGEKTDDDFDQEDEFK